MGYSYSSHQLAEVLIPKATGLLSIACSSLMARDVFKKWRGQRSNDHLPMAIRAIANMCVADLGSSFWGHFVGTWMIPAEYAYIKPFAVGNEATCSAQGFLFNLFIVSGGWCNAFLALTYYLTVCRQMPETQLRNWKYQLLLLGWPWMFGLTLALTNTIVGGGGTTWYHIWYCEAYAGAWVSYFSAVLIGLGLLIILFSMGSLVRVVYLTEKRMDRFRQGDDAANREKTLQVSKQGLSYIAVYLVTFIPVLVSLFGNPLPDGFYIFYACIFPLQGFFNAIVYFRPKYIAARKRRGAEGASRFGTMLGVLDLPVPATATWLATSLASILGRTSTTGRPSTTGQDSPMPEAGEAKDPEDFRGST